MRTIIHTSPTRVVQVAELYFRAESLGKQLGECLHPATLPPRSLILVYIPYDVENFLPEGCTLDEKFPILSATSPMQNIQGGCNSNRMGFALADRVSSAERPMRPKQRHSEKIDVEDASN